MSKRVVTSSTVKVVDKGWDGIIRDLREIGNSYAKVGLPHDGTTSGRHSMAELIEVGYAQEFGSERHNIPERSFMRLSFDQKRNTITQLQQQAVDKVRTGVSTARAALTELADEGVQIIKQKIYDQDSSWPELSKKTIAKKGTTVKLIETGQMVNSMQHKVVMRPFVGM